MGDPSTFQRLEAMTSDLAALVEEFGAVVYQGIEGEVLKEVAIAAGVDWTVDPTEVITRIGAALQRERDVNRELRRHIDALSRRVEELADRA